MDDFTLVFHRTGGGRVTAGPFKGTIAEVTDLAISLLPDFTDVTGYSIWSADGVAIAFNMKPGEDPRSDS